MVLLSTFGLTVMVDLSVAIQMGVVLASLLVMRRMAGGTQVRAVTDQLADEASAGFEAESPDVVLPPRTEVFEIAGSFFFGAAQRFSEALSEIQRAPRVVILRMRDVFSVDASGLHALEGVKDRFRNRGIPMLLSGVRAQPMMVLLKSGALDRFGERNALGSFKEASVRAREVSDEADEPTSGALAGGGAGP